jgi:hypothetical protein
LDRASDPLGHRSLDLLVHERIVGLDLEIHPDRSHLEMEVGLGLKHIATMSNENEVTCYTNLEAWDHRNLVVVVHRTVGDPSSVVGRSYRKAA